MHDIYNKDTIKKGYWTLQHLWKRKHWAYNALLVQHFTETEILANIKIEATNASIIDKFKAYLKKNLTSLVNVTLIDSSISTGKSFHILSSPDHKKHKSVEKYIVFSCTFLA